MLEFFLFLFFLVAFICRIIWLVVLIIGPIVFFAWIVTVIVNAIRD